MNFDLLVIGSGIAGLSFAIKTAAKGLRVAIVTKKASAESNTNHAQGGIACVFDQADDFENHVRDTLVAGDGLCDEAVTRAIVEAAPERIRELIAIGVDFSKGEDGGYDLTREGGHSHRRILHAHDLTGKAIEDALLAVAAKNPNISFFEYHMAIDLITTARLKGSKIAAADPENRVLGAYVLDVASGEVLTFRAGAVVLASGGIGQVYQYTTNPDIATGDGIAMAYRAGAFVRNMEFVQFHPTAMYAPDGSRELISESVRGEGAILRDIKGRAFMKDYDARGDLAPRDIVARAIDAEMKKSGAPHVWLDITHKPADYLRERFPHIYNTCLAHGIDMAKEKIPVVPAAHYLCGGVKTDMNAATSVRGLYACGETACTGLHGANRLASNSLLEAVVLAHNGAAAVADFLAKNPVPAANVPAWQDGNVQDSDERVVLSHNWDELRRAMWDYVGIVRTTKRLHRALTRVRMLKSEINEYYWNFKVEAKLLELRNLVQIGEIVILCAMQRHESRGLHCTLDYPTKSDEIYDSVALRPDFRPEERAGNKLAHN
ncbi:L-aspartate oxidase [Candidatus Spyradosoma sp. SGI.093]|uniref:L-aspartate oxidase n=1 Tax=Candidatus Spyradosoma sp. SGI.093 TaxID=3420583 RepID=UPI003D0123E3